MNSLLLNLNQGIQRQWSKAIHPLETKVQNSDKTGVARFALVSFFILQTVLLAGCKDTGGEVIGYVNGVLNRPSLSVSKVTINEGGSATVTIQLDRAMAKESELTWSVDAPSGQLSSSSGTTTVALDATAASFTLTSVGNSTSDGHRTYTLTVSGSSLYFASSATATITIVDDESEPLISISNISVTEGSSGSTNATFTVTVTGATSNPVVVNYATTGGTATSGADFTATSGTLTIPAGTSTGTISVPITTDTTYESNESFTLTLSGGSGYTSTGSTLSATCTILDDDLSSSTWNFSTPSDYTYSSNYIDLSSGTKAALKTVNTTFNDSSSFNSGTHVGTVYSGGVLKLDSSTGSDTSLSSSWTPHYSSLVGYWKMDGNWLDSSGSGNNGSTAGDATFTNSSKIGSHAGLFDGTGDYVTIANSALLQDIQETTFTVSYWGKITSSSGNAFVIGKAGFHDGISYEFSGSKYRIGCILWSTNGTDPSVYTGYVYEINTFQHVACSFNKANGFSRLYVNGGLVASKTNAASAAMRDYGTTPWRIGSPDGSTSFFTGTIDDLSLFNTSLSSADIAQIYNRQKQKYAGSYDSPVIDMGASGATWTSLASVSSLPFYKELPGSSGSESSSNYSSVGGNLMNGLVGMWHFDEASGTIANDASANSNVGTTNGTISLGSSGRLNTAYRLDGSSGYVSVTNSSSLNLGTESGGGTFSISGWIYLVSSTNVCRYSIYSQRNPSAPATGFSFSVGTQVTSACTSGSNMNLSLWEGGGAFASGTTSLTQNSWNHVVVSVSGASAYFYINGKAAGSGTVSWTSQAVTNTIGRAAHSSSAYFLPGSIDEVAIWSRALSSSEVLELYRRGANRVKYQARSCIDSSCACKAYSTSPAGSATDCDGDGIANANDTSDSYAADWIGPNGTASTYFSELQNNTSVDSSGNPTGSVNTTGLNLDWSGSFFTAAARPTANRYFQYRVYMESDDENNLCSSAPCMPEVTSITVGPTGRYYGGSPTIVNNAAISYTQLQAMTKSDTNACTTYQLSTDNGSTWKWWNGSAWTTTSSGVSTSNYLSDFTTSRLQSLSSGNYKFKAFLNTNTSSDFTQSCDLNSVGITYTP